jgi:hypothetical protein
MMVIISTNMNKTNNHLSPQTVKEKKTTEKDVGKQNHHAGMHLLP